MMDDLDFLRRLGRGPASGSEDESIRAAARAALDDAMSGKESRSTSTPRGRWQWLAPAVGFSAMAAVLVTLFAVTNKSDRTESASGSTVYRGLGLVLEQHSVSASGGSPHGPQLCLGPARLSAPPQCTGPDIDGWDWEAAGGKPTVAGGATWGEYVVTGTFDGRTFQLTRPPQAPSDIDRRQLSDLDPTEGTACDPPAGGWERRGTASSIDEVEKLAAEIMRSPDLSGVWIDRQSAAPAGVLNVRFWRNAGKHEAGLRQHFPGNLCVIQGSQSLTRLEEIRSELVTKGGILIDQVGKPLPIRGFLSSEINMPTGTVRIRVIRDDGTLQRLVDERFQSGVVEVVSALKPS